MESIAHLLKKNKLSGKDLGILVVADMANTVKQQAEGVPQELLVDASFIQARLKTMTSKQKEIYREYATVRNWLTRYFSIASSNEQAAQLRYLDLLSYIREASITEDIHEYISKLPAIMTKEQFERETKKGIQTYLKDENGNDKYDRVIDLILRAINYYTDELKNNSKRRNPIRAIRKAYIAEPINSALILDRYNVAAKNGYYTLPDGTRSDSMTTQEWMKANTTPLLRELLSASNGNEMKAMKDFGAVDKQIRLQEAKDFWESGEQPTREKERERLISAGLLYDAKWTPYDEPPDDITKWDIIEDGFAIPSLYPCLTSKTGDCLAYKKEILDFTTEFSELVQAVAAKIDSMGFLPFTIADKSPEEWDNYKVYWSTLYKNNVFDFAHKLNTHREIIFNGKHRAKINGVAVLQHYEESGFDAIFHCDRELNYLMPQIQYVLDSPYRLEDLFPEAESCETTAAAISESREALIESYYFMKAYNLLIDMIADRYEIPNLEPMKMKLAAMEDKIEHLNECVLILYRRIAETEYDDDTMKQKKLDALKKHFAKIECETITPPEKNTQMAELLLTEGEAFRTSYILEDVFLYRTLRPGSPFEGVL